MSELGVVAALHRDTNSLSAVIPSRSLRLIEGISYGGEPPPPLSWGWFDDEGAGGSWVYNRPRGPVRQLLHDDFLHVGGGGVLHLRDEKAANTAGGTFTSGAWRTRTLNTETENTIGGASLASNQFTLPAGSYWVEATAPAFNVNTHKAKLRNVTDGTDAIVGTSEWTATASSPQTTSFVEGLVTIAATKTFELQHQCLTTMATQGFGVASNFGVVEVYAEVIVRKVGADGAETGSDYGDTPWAIDNTVGYAQITSQPSGHGVIRLTNPVANTIELLKADNSLLAMTDRALWLSTRVRVGGLPGGSEPNYWIGFNNGSGGARTQFILGISNPTRWIVSANLEGSHVAASEEASGVEAAVDEWVDLDLVCVGNGFAAGWINGDGPYVPEGGWPAAGAASPPTFRVQGTSADEYLDIDYVRVVAFSDFAGPDALAPSMEGIVEDAIAQT